jgi:peptidoglycan/LPS O-acetylase OafA/YrhL
VNKGLLRTLGALLGTAFILLAVPIGNLDRGFWPRWLVMLSILGFGVILLVYAATGRSNPFRKNNDDN